MCKINEPKVIIQCILYKIILNLIDNWIYGPGLIFTIVKTIDDL